MFDWHSPPPNGGPCALEILITWLKHNCNLYIQPNTHKRGKKMLKKLQKEISLSGHRGCYVKRIQSQITNLQKQVIGKQRFSPSNESYRSRLVEVFGGEKTAVGGPHVRSEDVESSSDSDVTDISQVMEDSDAGVNSEQSKRATNRLSWMDPSPTGGPCAMELLVQWLRQNYSRYVNSPGNGGKKRKVLSEFSMELKKGGLHELSPQTIRAQVNALRRQATGRKSATESFRVYGALLREIFNSAPVSNNQGNQRSTRTSGGDEQSSRSIASLCEGQERDDDNRRSEQKGESESDNLQPEELQTRREHFQRGAPTSVNEVTLVASILRERHDLRGRGVPQSEIDEYLPLP